MVSEKVVTRERFRSCDGLMDDRFPFFINLNKKSIPPAICKYPLLVKKKNSERIKFIRIGLI